MFALDPTGGATGGLPTLNVADFFNVQPIPDGEEVYDKLMAAIEPELTTKEVAGLKVKYAAETPEQKEERRARYAKAFAEYERQFAQYLSQRNGTLVRVKAEALKSLEDQEKAQDNKDMASLEVQMLSA